MGKFSRVVSVRVRDETLYEYIRARPHPAKWINAVLWLARATETQKQTDLAEYAAKVQQKQPNTGD